MFTRIVLPVLPFRGVFLSSTLNNTVCLKNVFNFSLYKNKVRLKMAVQIKVLPSKGIF